MTTKPLIAMSALICSTPLTDATAQQEFSLENSVYGGKEMGKFYPYSLSSWACQKIDGIVYYTQVGKLICRYADGHEAEATSIQKLRELAGNEYLSIVSAESPEAFLLTDGSDLFRVDIKTNQKTTIFTGPYDVISVAPSSGWVSFTDGDDLYVANGGQKTRVNKEKENGLRFGSPVHRNEFGIEGGMFWSPDGTRLCFYRKDERMVTNYPLVDVTARVGKVVNTRYPMAGERSEEVSVGVFDVRDGKTLYLKTPSPVDRYFTNISWSPDGDLIGVAEVNRDQDHLWYNIYDSHTGELVKTLFEETDAHWVEPCEPALWTDATHLAWQSYRDGFNHIYLYDIKTAKATQLTKGDWCVCGIYGFDTHKKRIIAQTNSEGYLYRDVCAISLKGKMTRLSPERTVSSASYTTGQSLIVINSSSPAMAKESRIVSVDGKNDIVNSKADPYAGFAKPEIRTVDLKSADGKFPLTGRIILPTNFDPSKKYPTIVYVYGGPHSQLVNGGWLNGASPWMLYFAQEGYIVFTMDNRGTEKRGSAFEQVVHRQLGVCEMEDQMMGVEYLRSLPYVDQDRMGVHGWSFGGYMTISLLTTHPEVFKAGVAGGPVCDWKYYEVMYGERYMDTPQQNPEGYEKTSLLNKIGKLDTRLLIIHGAMDSTVVWQHSQALLNSAIEAGKYIDYSVYPNHPHNVSGHDRTHLIGYIKRYFDTFLKPQEK